MMKAAMISPTKKCPGVALPCRNIQMVAMVNASVASDIRPSPYPKSRMAAM